MPGNALKYVLSSFTLEFRCFIFVPRGILPEKSAMFFFFGMAAFENVLFMFRIERCSSVGAVGNFDLTSLMVGGILYILCWSFVTALVDISFTKVPGGV